jgi:hypothetical protein
MTDEHVQQLVDLYQKESLELIKHKKNVAFIASWSVFK